jgi:hypothetical protein
VNGELGCVGVLAGRVQADKGCKSDEFDKFESPDSPLTEFKSDEFVTFESPDSPLTEFKCDEFVKFESPDSPLTEFKCDEFVKFDSLDSPHFVGPLISGIVVSRY